VVKTRGTSQVRLFRLAPGSYIYIHKDYTIYLNLTGGQWHVELLKDGAQGSQIIGVYPTLKEAKQRVEKELTLLNYD
jgi:hypothetical protein